MKDMIKGVNKQIQGKDKEIQMYRKKITYFEQISEKSIDIKQKHTRSVFDSRHIT